MQPSEDFNCLRLIIAPLPSRLNPAVFQCPIDFPVKKFYFAFQGASYFSSIWNRRQTFLKLHKRVMTERFLKPYASFSKLF